MRRRRQGTLAVVIWNGLPGTDKVELCLAQTRKGRARRVRRSHGQPTARLGLPLASNVERLLRGIEFGNLDFRFGP